MSVRQTLYKTQYYFNCVNLKEIIFLFFDHDKFNIHKSSLLSMYLIHKTRLVAAIDLSLLDSTSNYSEKHQKTKTKPLSPHSKLLIIRYFYPKNSLTSNSVRDFPRIMNVLFSFFKIIAYQIPLNLTLKYN